METTRATFTNPTGVAFRCSNCKAARRVEFLHTVEHVTRVLDGRMFVSRSNTWAPAEPVLLSPSVADDRQAPPRIRCSCGARMLGQPICGTLNPAVKCGGKCTHAKGHVCECECGGANHGKGNAAQ